MIPIDLSGKVALVTGVGDNESFAWFIAKALNAAGAKIVLASHPRMVGIVETFLSRDMDKESRTLSTGGELKVEKVFAMDANFDTMADVDEKTRGDKRWNKYPIFAIKEVVEAVGQEFSGIDIVIHSMAFSRDILKPQIETSRSAYLEALGISAFSYTSLLRYARPFMVSRGGGSAVGLTYIGGSRVIPHYGGGMSTAKAALQLEAGHLAWSLGEDNIRVNLISAGPYLSRAMKAIKPGEAHKMVEYAASRSPLRRAITPEEVADTTAFLCSPLASGITGHTLYVDAGYNVMGG
ncbi:SDR family oxidoreductase [Zavarzinella formosa]|uniref:SDR family oxidoreductase n=1 Tax=Zavarzinella formosa TaxID=360055 RepID=UPI0002E4CB4B|nr:SDR family oxidoreductase [Zavarzinella formosa]